MDKDMNLVEEYILRNEKLIIIVSGLSGSNRSQLAKNIERDFKIKRIDLDLYCNKENTKIFELSNGIKITDWEHIDIFDWKKFNKDVNESKKEGLIVCGDYFPTEKLEFKTDFHLHVKLSKQKLMEKRNEYIKKNPDKCPELVKFLDTPIVNLIMKQITYKYYLDYRDKSKIDKYLNGDENTPEQIYDQSFDYLMYSMRKFLDQYYETNIPKNIKKKDDTDITEDSIYIGSYEDELAEAQFLP